MLTGFGASAGVSEPPVERRTSPRQRLLLRVAKLRCQSGEYLCVIHDVSETGVRVRLFNAHPPDRHLFLELADGELYAIERRWMKGIFAGYVFSCRVEIDEFLNKGRKPDRPVRLRIAHPVRIGVAGDCGRAELVNLSQHGACIEADREIPLRAPLRIELPGAAPRLAHICWRRNYRHGLVFQQALPLEELARLALELQPYGIETMQAVPYRNQVYALTA